MDEIQYRDTYHAINERRCLFEKSILARSCDCTHQHRFFLGDREGVACTDAGAHSCCADWLERLRMESRFVRGLEDAPAVATLSHRLQVKLQAGGMLGLAKHLEDTGALPNVAELLDEACHQHGTLARIPLGDVIASIEGYEPRSRRPGRGSR